MRYRIGSLCLLSALATLFTLVPAGPASGGQSGAPCELKDDAAYTAAIRKDTTEPFFSTELVDHLPWSSCVPAPDTYPATSSGRPTCSTM